MAVEAADEAEDEVARSTKSRPSTTGLAEVDEVEARAVARMAEDTSESESLMTVCMCIHVLQTQIDCEV